MTQACMGIGNADKSQQTIRQTKKARLGKQNAEIFSAFLWAVPGTGMAMGMPMGDK